MGAGRITIQKAVYGAVGAGGSADVTRKLTKLINAGSATVAVSNSNFGGDPAPSVVKQLKIQYKIDGKAGEATFPENAAIMLPLPK